MRIRGVASGALSLIALEVIVTSKQTSRIAELLTLPASWARWLIDPNVPAIPDHTNVTATATATTTAAPAVGKLPGSTSNPIVTTGI